MAQLLRQYSLAVQKMKQLPCDSAILLLTNTQEKLKPIFTEKLRNECS